MKAKAAAGHLEEWNNRQPPYTLMKTNNRTRVSPLCGSVKDFRSKSYSSNDAGRADRFIDRFGENIRYVPEQGYWFVWNNRRWQIDTDGALERLALKMSREMLMEAFDMPAINSEQDERKGAIKEALRCGDRRNIQDYLSLARVNRRIILPNDCLIPKLWIVAAKNAIVDLRTGKMRRYSREDFVMRSLGCDITPRATCPRWLRFMRQILPNSNLRRFVQKAAGYSLTGMVASEKCFLFLHGHGDNGKTTFVETLLAVLGSYAVKAGYRLFYSTEHLPVPEDQIAELFGRRFVFASETKEGARLNEHTVKDITGGDTLRGAGNISMDSLSCRSPLLGSLATTNQQSRAPIRESGGELN